jgi:hypothetical protein
VRVARREAAAGTENGRVRSALRIGGVAVVAALALGLTPSVAEAAPKRPSDTQISAAQAAADAVATRIDELSGQLTAAQDTVDTARATSLIALDEFQATQAAYDPLSRRRTPRPPQPRRPRQSSTSHARRWSPSRDAATCRAARGPGPRP